MAKTPVRTPSKTATTTATKAGRKASRKAAKVKTPALYRLLGPALAVPTGIVVKKVADTTWLKVRGYPPPKNPAAPNVSWPDALAWAAASGVLVAAGRLVAARGAAAAYQALTGKLPPGVNADSAA